MAEIVTFHGADGCGKSSIAASLLELRQSGGDATMIGGSSYKQWLTADVARETLGNSDIIGAPAYTTEQKNHLYEAIAAACYGYAHHLAETGTDVVIDSDPVIKRVLWSRLEQPDPPQQQQYVSRFGAYLLDHLPGDLSLDVVVGVNIEGTTPDDEIQQRLSERGGNSEYDPQTADEVHTICTAAVSLWRDLSASRHGEAEVAFFNELYGTSQFTAIDNPGCCQSSVEQQLHDRALAVNRLLQ